MLRLGLCCKFEHEPIKFRDTTAAALARLHKKGRENKLAELCLDNAAALLSSINYCAENGIGCFRINSRILPLYTHPKFGYTLNRLPNGAAIRKAFVKCGTAASRLGIRLTFHPDQFILLNSPDTAIVRSSVKELKYQSMMSKLVGADVITIHAGGAYGDKPSALNRFARTFAKLPKNIREKLAVENDDRLYTPADLLPLCKKLKLPFVYDVHHHRCNPDGMSEDLAAQAALKTWNREPLFHVSSPKYGWKSATPRPHADFINPADFPASWRRLDITVEVEAKAKELALKKLISNFKKNKAVSRLRP